MHIKENDQIPNVDVFVMEDGEPVKKNTQIFLKDKKSSYFWSSRSLHFCMLSKTSPRICEHV